MKVLLVANVAKEHVNKFHIPTIKYMQSRGWQVDVACNVDDVIPAADKVYNMSWTRSPFSLKILKGIRELKHILKQNNYDIIYCHTPVGGLVSRLASREVRKLGTKVVYCAHGLHFYSGAPIINWLLFYPIERMLARMTDMFLTINLEDYNRVKTSFNQEMLVKLLPGIGVNFERLDVDCPDEIRDKYRENLEIPNDAKVLIYVAEIIKNKNQQMLIRSLKLLHESGQKMYLLLTGPDHSKGELHKLTETLGLKEYVKFLGWRNDIGELMATSDMCVASSVREGFGINLLEAQYCHLPVVATLNRGHSTVIQHGDNGFLVPLNDYKAMASQITQVFDDKDLYSRLTKIEVSNYRSDKIAKLIYDYLQEFKISNK